MGKYLPKGIKLILKDGFFDGGKGVYCLNASAKEHSALLYGVALKGEVGGALYATVKKTA